MRFANPAPTDCCGWALGEEGAPDEKISPVDCVCARLVRFPAFAADLPVKAVKAPPPPPPSWWEIAYGGAIMSDYNFRGVSQSDRSIAGTFYVEGRANVIPEKLQIYGGIQPWTTKLPTEPTGEFDFYGGIRSIWGPVTFDFGAIYYYYPRESQIFVLPTAGPVGVGFPTSQPNGNPLYIPWTVADTDFWEIYGKVTWTVNDWLALGAYVYLLAGPARFGRRRHLRRRYRQTDTAERLVPRRFRRVYLG